MKDRALFGAQLAIFSLGNHAFLEHGEWNGRPLTMMSYGALALSIMLGVIGQILLKAATNHKSALPFNLGPFNELFLAAAGIYAASLILYTFSLQKIPLTIAYPSVSISYIGVALLSSFFFGTSIGIKDLAGFALIALGVGLIGSSQS